MNLDEVLDFFVPWLWRKHFLFARCLVERSENGFKTKTWTIPRLQPHCTNSEHCATWDERIVIVESEMMYLSRPASLQCAKYKSWNEVVGGKKKNSIEYHNVRKQKNVSRFLVYFCSIKFILYTLLFYVNSSLCPVTVREIYEHLRLHARCRIKVLSGIG